MKEIIGNHNPSKCFDSFFSKEVLLEINWDGVKNKIGVKKMKAFNIFLFGMLLYLNCSFYLIYFSHMCRSCKIGENGLSRI